MSIFDDFIKASAKLISIKSVEESPLPDMPFGKGVADALDTALDYAEKLGFRIKNGDGYYGYAEIGEGNEMIAALGHLDTVPIGNGWTIPPLDGAIIDGYLCGRGVLDDKVPILACLFATYELIQEGKKPNKRIRIIFGCDEESGWQCMERYLQNEELPTMAFTPDSDFPVINCEKGVVYYDIVMPKPDYIKSINGGDRPNMVMDKVVAELYSDIITNNDILTKYGIEKKGNILTACGVSAHGSSPFIGDNAFWKLVKFFAENYGGEWSKLSKIVLNTDGSGYNLKLHDDISGDLTINIGTIYTSDNDIHFSLDIRYPISYNKEYITEVLVKTFDEYKVRQGFYHNPLYVPPNHELCRILLDAYEQITGEKSEPITIGGGTYARALPTAVAFGPVFPNQESTIHQKDERAKISDLKKMYDIYKVAICKLGFDNQ